jgi:Sulfotransferase domain
VSSRRVNTWTASSSRPDAVTASGEASADVHAIQGRVPDFFIVGHPKCGTSALYRMLRDRPQIHMPRKEPSFFVPEIRRSRRYSAGLQDYTAMFTAATPEQRIGEATTSYLWSRNAAARIAELQPGARIIAILREPASFLRSLHLQFIQSNVETERDLRKAIELEMPRSEGKRLPPNSARPQALLYSQHLHYVEQLRRYHAVFPPEQILVLIYDDFRADNEATVRRVLRFLEVDDSEPVGVTEANPTVRVRSPRLYGLMRSLYLGRGPASGALKAAIKAVTPQQLRYGGIRAARHRALAGEPAPADAELMRELRARFKGEVVALSEYLDRDLVTFWGYDGID